MGLESQRHLDVSRVRARSHKNTHAHACTAPTHRCMQARIPELQVVLAANFCRAPTCINTVCKLPDLPSALLGASAVLLLLHTVRENPSQLQEALQAPVGHVQPLCGRCVFGSSAALVIVWVTCIRSLAQVAKLLMVVATDAAVDVATCSRHAGGIGDGGLRFCLRTL